MRSRGSLFSSGEKGFTLIELLVVMVIIGVLASISIPVYLSQQAKARDAATKSDVGLIGKELAAFYVGGTGRVYSCWRAGTAGGPPSWSFYTATACSGTQVGSTVPLSQGTTYPSSYETAAGADPSTTWCLSLTNPQGSIKTFRFSATKGLESGVSCSTYVP